jgi:hypothetical protein
VTSPPSLYVQDTLLLRVAREIAINLHDIETILSNNQISPEAWERIKSDPRFQRLLDGEVQAWHAAGNTTERTKLKAGALIEEFLPEANARLHDRGESLAAKTELMKTLARVAGMGERAAIEGASGGGFTVTINLGADHKLEFQKAALPSKVIDGEVLEKQ